MCITEYMPGGDLERYYMVSLLHSTCHPSLCFAKYFNIKHCA